MIAGTALATATCLKLDPPPIPPLVISISLGLLRLGLGLDPLEVGGGRGGVDRSPLVSSRPRSWVTRALTAPHTSIACLRKVRGSGEIII